MLSERPICVPKQKEVDAMIFEKSRNGLAFAGRIVSASVFLFALTGLAETAGATTLADLVQKAKQEGALNATVISSLTGRETQPLAAAFKKRFGLDINVTITPILNTQNYPKAIAETKAGSVPTYDAIEGSDTNNMALIGVGGALKIDNWERLLAEINPVVRAGKARPEQLSPGPLKGLGFAHLSRTKSLIYNPKLISRDKLPRTHADLALSQYKGMWTQPPWTTHWEPGPLVVPEMSKEKWVEIVRQAGRNGGAVQVESAGVQRLLLGEFAFTMANTHYYFSYKAKDPQAPIEITFFKDFNVTTDAYYIVRKNARNPAAGTLFALWIATPEAQAIWQPRDFNTQRWGESELDKKERKFMEESGAKLFSFMDSEKGLEYLNWMSTDDGRNFKEALGKGIRGE